MKAITFASLLATSTFIGAGHVQASEWNIDTAHTTAQFSVRHLMVSDVKGTFTKVSGTVDLNDKDPTKSSVDVVIDAASIDTREPKRDEHLKSPEFFDVAKHPKITFKSTQIKKAGKDKFKVTGDLTMRGVTKPVVLDVVGPSAPVKNPWGMTVRGLTATGKLNRKEFGLNWNKALEAGGVLVGDEVKLVIDAELVEKPTPPTAQAQAQDNTTSDKAIPPSPPKGTTATEPKAASKDKK